MGKTTNLNWFFSPDFRVPSTVWWADITHLGHLIRFVWFISSIRWCGLVGTFHPARHRWETKSSQWSTCNAQNERRIKTNPDIPCMGIYSYIYLKKWSKCRWIYHTWILWESILFGRYYLSGYGSYSDQGGSARPGEIYQGHECLHRHRGDISLCISLVAP